MKKRLLGSLLLLPLLASCSGFPVSKEEALNILENIEKEVENSSKSSYTQNALTVTYDAKTGNPTETTIISIYSKESKYFHTYTISTQNDGRMAESWKFVKDYTFTLENKSEITDTFIFDITRNITPSSLEQPLEKQYIVTYEKYSEEGWEKYADEYEDRLARRFSDAIEHSRNLLNDEANSLDLKSFNGNSLNLNCKQVTEGTTKQTTEYNLDIYNNQLVSIKTSVTDVSKTETTFTYSSGDITYPAFKANIQI